MNRKYLMMAVLAAGLAGPIAAQAQQTDSQQPAPQQAAPMPNSQDLSTAPHAYGNTPDSTVNPATQAGAPASATVGDENNPANAAMPNAAAPTADASGTQVISNGPIPDTPANRKKYGRPMSMAGRMTKPAGN